MRSDTSRAHAGAIPMGAKGFAARNYRLGAATIIVSDPHHKGGAKGLHSHSSGNCNPPSP